MSMDRDYQTKDEAQDSLNRGVIIAIVVVAALIFGTWIYTSWF